MDWASLSSNLNPMENMWEHLLRKVFENGLPCQYFSTKDLTTAIEHAWYVLRGDANLSTFNGKPCL